MTENNPNGEYNIKWTCTKLQLILVRQRNVSVVVSKNFSPLTALIRRCAAATIMCGYLLLLQHNIANVVLKGRYHFILHIKIAKL